MQIQDIEYFRPYLLSIITRYITRDICECRYVSEGEGRLAWWFLAAGIISVLQPWLLGFYLDDWSTIVAIVANTVPFSSAMLQSIWGIDPSRPISGLVRFLYTSVLMDVPQAWHVSLVACNLTIVMQLARLQCMLFPLTCGSRPIWTLAASCIWLIFPWSVGFRFWPVLLNVHLYIIIFLWLVLFILRRWRSGVAPWVAPFGVYLAICLGYEAFYGQFIIFILLGLIEYYFHHLRIRHLLKTISALVCAQGVAFGWYFLSGRLTTAQKPIDSEWQAVLGQNLTRLIPEMFRSMGALGLLAYFAVVVGLLVGAIILWRARKRCESEGDERVMAAAVSMAFLAGAVVSVLAYSLGSRPILALGVESRGFSIVSLWLVPAVAIPTLVVLRVSGGWTRHVFVTSLGVIATVLLLSSMGRLRDWSEAARMQQSILQSVPVGSITTVDPDVPILVVWPIDVNGAPVFASPWDVNSAIHVRYPALSSRRFILYSHWGGRLAWDGKTLQYEHIPGVLATTSRLCLWRPFHGEFLEVDRPIQVRGDLNWEFLEETKVP